MRYPERDDVIPNHDSGTVDGEFHRSLVALEHAYLAGEYSTGCLDGRFLLAFKREKPSRYLDIYVRTDCKE